MIKHENIAEMAQTFVNALQDATQKAKTEKDFDDLENIVIDLLSRIPVSIMHKDYFPRSAIRQRMEPDNQENTEFINKLMQYIYNEDAVYMGDYVIENIDDCIDELEQ